MALAAAARHRQRERPAAHPVARADDGGRPWSIARDLHDTASTAVRDRPHLQGSLRLGHHRIPMPSQADRAGRRRLDLTAKHIGGRLSSRDVALRHRQPARRSLPWPGSRPAPWGSSRGSDRRSARTRGYPTPSVGRWWRPCVKREQLTKHAGPAGSGVRDRDRDTCCSRSSTRDRAPGRARTGRQRARQHGGPGRTAGRVDDHAGRLVGDGAGLEVPLR